MARGAFRARCVDCRRIAQASIGTRWCDNCGGELKPVQPTRRDRKRRGRR